MRYCQPRMRYFDRTGDDRPRRRFRRVHRTTYRAAYGIRRGDLWQHFQHGALCLCWDGVR